MSTDQHKGANVYTNAKCVGDWEGNGFSKIKVTECFQEQ